MAGFGARKSQTRAVMSSEPVTIHRLFGLKINVRTVFLCPGKTE